MDTTELYALGSNDKTKSRTSTRETARHLAEAQEGKHFDGSKMVRFGEFKYPSSTFPIPPNLDNKILVAGYAASYPLDLMVGRLVEETNRAMNPNKSFTKVGDTEFDLKMRRNIETSPTYPVVPGDIVQIGFDGFNYEWNQEERPYVKLFSTEGNTKIPSLFYEIYAVDPAGNILKAKAVQGQVQRGKAPECLADVLRLTGGLGDCDMPDGSVMSINDLANNYEILKVHAQILIHIKYSDKENRVEAGYQSGVKKEELHVTEKIDTSADFSAFFQQGTEGLEALAQKANSGDTAIVERNISSVDPHAETQVITPEQKNEVVSLYDLLESIPVVDPSSYNKRMIRRRKSRRGLTAVFEE